MASHTERALRFAARPLVRIANGAAQCAVEGALAGAAVGAMSDLNNGNPFLTGTALGAAKGAGVGAVVGGAAALADEATGAVRATLRAAEAVEGYLPKAWQAKD